MSALVSADMLRFDPEQQTDLNALARLFYASFGYEVPEGYDFFAATHPQEQSMFSLACIAAWYSREIGL